MNTIVKQAMITRNQVISKDLTAVDGNRKYATVLQRFMSNWVKVAAIIYSDSATDTSVLALLGYELKNKRRSYIIKRLYSRYSELRRKREVEEIREWITSDEPSYE